MRLVEIAGHNIDPRMVADVGPIRPIDTDGIDTWGFQVCASGVTIWDFIYKEGAEKIRRDLLAAIESAEQAARESLQEATHWRKSWPRIKMTDADIAEAQKLMAQHEGPPGELLPGMHWIRHPVYGWTMEPDIPGTTYAGGQVVREMEIEASDALVGVECGPEERGTFRDGKFVKAMEETKIRPDLELPSVR